MAKLIRGISTMAQLEKYVKMIKTLQFNGFEKMKINTIAQSSVQSHSTGDVNIGVKVNEKN